jgi:cytoplasmic iron level regulating protein YaaA (DUF328/UPF0246 family)
MLAIISPAKKLDFKKELPFNKSTEIRFPEEAARLADRLKSFSPAGLIDLMNISFSLAQLNTERFHKWHWPYNGEDSRQAVYAFNGEAYNGLDAFSLSKEEVETAQKQLRILSGLYGLLRPLDLILPYRLEMGTKLETPKGKDLYAFWGDKITQKLNEDLNSEEHKVLVNLASQEYFKSVDPGKIDKPIVTPVFKEYKNDQYKVISIYAKKARGMMIRFIIRNKLSDPEDLKAFDIEGYHFNNDLSTENELVFTRH